jgi:hypothetical protein
VSLEKEGVPAPEIRRCLQILRGQFTEQPEGIEMIYDPLYSKPLTGDLEKDGFKTAPVDSLGQALHIGSNRWTVSVTNIIQCGLDFPGICI